MIYKAGLIINDEVPNARDRHQIDLGYQSTKPSPLLRLKIIPCSLTTLAYIHPMKRKITDLRKNYPLLFKMSIALLYIAFHLLVSRPIRTAIFSLQVSPNLVEKVEQHPSFSFQKLDTRLFYIEYNQKDEHEIWHYKVPFGSFFLFGMVGLILMGAHKNMFSILILAHTLIFLITWLVFATDLLANPYLLNIPDFLSRYMAPLSALGVIPLAFMTKRGNSVSTKQ